MNKSIVTNIIAITVWGLGYLTHQPYLTYAGLFAFSGAVTNWLAIHMLFEKVPGLYGSGVILTRFEEFKTAIKTLLMEQFFNQEQLEKAMSQTQGSDLIDFEPILNKIDFEPTFHDLVDVIEASSFGGMLGMLGGKEALLPLKEPFIDKMQVAVVELSQQPQVQDAIQTQLQQPFVSEKALSKVEMLIDQRLAELTPQMVKQMVQDLIKQHLGWLVVWGGVFGGLIGLLSKLVMTM
ncbi:MULTISPECIES: DUF445 domain-containing protein [unclassified Vibrio]|uniref:DUF445 domain-containing protein n=1 Tax=Vibrio sp. HB236076 TaxID=3232307 RepID=A0AB39HKH5_9VIBR|nr:DUF445 domain-containing protein [Vibrio sp. HB161653]MDP5252596.1 DUF445 domain-containing protein [Vibrio sp. HB161653]